MSSPQLNASQREAVLTRRGPLLVLAGAGTGKTRVITYRISELITQGVEPSRILAVTFTNKAAREMRERAMALLGRKRRKGQKGPEISTFHSLCVRILRRHITRLGYPSQFAIYDQSDQESVARSALRDVRVSHEQLRPGDLLSIIGGWKTRSIGPEEAVAAAQTDRYQFAALAYGRYQAALRAAGAVDFDDLLLLTEELLTRSADIRAAEAGRFDHLLIDEYQDTNGLQYRIVKMLAERHRNICVVGDDDQSIYAWRGAEVTHILAFERDWPGATVVRLEENYRSRQAILDYANTLIAHNKERHGKVLRASRRGGEPPRIVRFENETAEATEIVREIRARLDAAPPDRLAPRDLAILFRTNEQPRAFELELRRAKIPYVLIGGMSFYDRKEVRDILAYLKVLAHPLDEISLLRIINTPRRGIGAAVVQLLLEDAVHQGKPLWDVLPRSGVDSRLPPGAAARIAGFCSMIDGYRKRLSQERLAAIASDLVDHIQYKAELERVYKTPTDIESRWESIGELLSALSGYEARAESPTLQGFLEETTLAGRDDQKDADDKRQRNALTLMTLHSAKGLEFPHVYMVGMEESVLPHRRTVEEGGGRGIAEERRLCYVGVTRAQDSLTLSFCTSRMKWGALRPCIPSRFLMEMTGDTERALKAAEASEKQIAAQAQDGRRKAAAGGSARRSSRTARASGGRRPASSGAAADPDPSRRPRQRPRR